MTSSSGHFEFKTSDSIGDLAAETDSLLSDCFYNTGDIDRLLDTTNPQCLVLGRTGAGKTALLMRVLEDKRGLASRIEPASACFNHVSNSNFISSLRQQNIQLFLFFKILWQHILIVELLQLRFSSQSPQPPESMWERISAFIGVSSPSAKRKKSPQGDASLKKAQDFLEKWGGEYLWETTAIRTEQFLKRFEKKFESAKNEKHGGGIHVGMPTVAPLKADLSGSSGRSELHADTATYESRSTEDHTAQDIVKSTLVDDISGLWDVLTDVFSDEQKKYYVVVDGLDEHWVDDSFEADLIVALVEAARQFGRLSNVKVVISLRIDLLARALRLSAHRVQEEKLRPNFLVVSWSRKGIEGLLDSRVSRLIRDRYTKATPTILDIMGDGGAGSARRSLDYVIDRTWLRPRDAIEYFNLCIARSAGSPRIAHETVQSVEQDYSRFRRRALVQEWGRIYPWLESAIEGVLRRRRTPMCGSDFTDDDALRIIELLLPGAEVDSRSPLSRLIKDYIQALPEVASEKRFGLMSYLFAVFVRVGCVSEGLRGSDPSLWQIDDDDLARSRDYSPDTEFHIHPGLGLAVQALH